jgi:hypothetical protein
MPKTSYRRPKGSVRLYQVPGLAGPEGWKPRTGWVGNLALYEWGAVFGNLLLKKGLNYGIGGLYIEYENTDNPGDDVTAPALTRAADEGIEYYNALADSSTRDYLRVPLIAGTLTSSDQTLYPKGNLLTLFAQTTGVNGVHGKGFSVSDNSKVYGAAVVAFVDDDDYTRDLVLSKVYFSAANQQEKLDNSQVGIEWRMTFK